MNHQQYAVFLKHLLETDSIPGVSVTETITLWDAAGSLAAGWLPTPMNDKTDRVSLILHSYSPLSLPQIHSPSSILST